MIPTQNQTLDYDTRPQLACLDWFRVKIKRSASRRQTRREASSNSKGTIQSDVLAERNSFIWFCNLEMLLKRKLVEEFECVSEAAEVHSANVHRVIASVSPIEKGK